MKIRVLANLSVLNRQQVKISHAMVRVYYRIPEPYLHILIALVLRNRFDISVVDCLKILSFQMIHARIMTYWSSLSAQF